MTTSGLIKHPISVSIKPAAAQFAITDFTLDPVLLVELPDPGLNVARIVGTKLLN